MRSWSVSLVLVALTSCAPRAARPADDADERMPCDPVATTSMGPRVDGGRVLVESVLTRQVCRGEDIVEPPVRFAEIRLRPDLPACPVGQLGARRWPGDFAFEPALRDFVAAQPQRQRDAVQTALADFSQHAQAYVIGCPPGGPTEWLFVEEPQVGNPNSRWPLHVAFFDGAGLRAAPGHENVLFPDVGPAPSPPPPEPDPFPVEPPGPESELAEEPEPPRVTSQGCPAQQVRAQWMVRRFGPHRLPGPETMERWWLQLDGATATLVFERQQRPKHGPGKGVWTCVDAATVQGTVARKGTSLRLAFGGTKVRCNETVWSLPPATAKRDPTPLPQREDEEGCDRFRWATRQRVKTKALVCSGDLPLDALRVFGPPPGIERLALENDCWEASDRESMRLVPADGSLAPGR